MLPRFLAAVVLELIWDDDAKFMQDWFSVRSACSFLTIKMPTGAILFLSRIVPLGPLCPQRGIMAIFYYVNFLGKVQ